MLVHAGTFTRLCFAAFFATTLLTSAVAQPVTGFTDLPQQADVHLAITHMAAQGIMSERAAGRFGPKETSSLGEYLVSMQHMFNLPPPARPAKFTDVPPSSRYYAAVQAASPYLGRQVLCFTCALSTNLYPDQPLSRAQTTVTLVNVLVARGKLALVDETGAAQILANVRDAGKLSPPARRYFATAISANILPLSPAGTLQIADLHTRADLALMLDRVQTQFHVPQVHPIVQPHPMNSPGASP